MTTRFEFGGLYSGNACPILFSRLKSRPDQKIFGATESENWQKIVQKTRPLLFNRPGFNSRLKICEDIFGRAVHAQSNSNSKDQLVHLGGDTFS